MSVIFRKLNKYLNRHPMTTQMIVSGGISFAGDIFAQYLDGLKQWDRIRTLRFIALMGVAIVPPQVIWYRCLQRVQHASRHVRIAKRLAYDQFLFNPTYCAAILFSLPVLEGFSVRDSLSKMQHDWFDVYVSSLTIWPIVQLFNFYCVPFNYRVILIQSVGLVWSAYLSMKTSHKTLQ